MKKGDHVHITWIDTYDPQIPSWADDDQIAEAIAKENTIAESVGYFYKETADHIYIYGDKLDTHYSRITGIPKGCIKTIKKIRKGET